MSEASTCAKIEAIESMFEREIDRVQKIIDDYPNKYPHHVPLSIVKEEYILMLEEVRDIKMDEQI